MHATQREMHDRELGRGRSLSQSQRTADMLWEVVKDEDGGSGRASGLWGAELSPAVRHLQASEPYVSQQVTDESMSVCIFVCILVCTPYACVHECLYCATPALSRALNVVDATTAGLSGAAG